MKTKKDLRAWGKEKIERIVNAKTSPDLRKTREVLKNELTNMTIKRKYIEDLLENIRQELILRDVKKDLNLPRGGKI